MIRVTIVGMALLSIVAIGMIVYGVVLSFKHKDDPLKATPWFVAAIAISTVASTVLSVVMKR